MNDPSIYQPSFGKLVLFGSGETSPVGRKVFDSVMKELPQNPRLVLLETPAGFELNSAQVIGRVGQFFEHRLQNYQPRVSIIPARKRGTPFSPDNQELVSPILESDLIFMGPGSPTYAIRQLRDSLAWNYMLARHGLGATLVLASSAVVAISAYALPVYEIYKVGEELHWIKGLDFFGRFGLPLVFIPHWNNQDGGEELDTSRCFMGQSRFAELMQLLPPDVAVIGIDEKTALVLELQSGECHVQGAGGITIIHSGHDHMDSSRMLAGTELDEIAAQRQSHLHSFQHGEVFSLEECCPIQVQSSAEGLEPLAWGQALTALSKRDAEQQQMRAEASPSNDLTNAPPTVQKFVADRQLARENKDWSHADTLRKEIELLGWKVTDTPDGPQISRSDNAG